MELGRVLTNPGWQVWLKKKTQWHSGKGYCSRAATTRVDAQSGHAQPFVALQPTCQNEENVMYGEEADAPFAITRHIDAD